MAWVGSEGHKLVMAWLAEMCRAIGRAHDSPADAAVVQMLRQEIVRGQQKTRRQIIPVRNRKQRQLVGIMKDLSLLVLGAGAPFGLSEVGIEDLPRGSGLPQRLGWIRPEYTGPQWPYLYVVGRPETKRRRTRQ